MSSIPSAITEAPVTWAKVTIAATTALALRSLIALTMRAGALHRRRMRVLRRCLLRAFAPCGISEGENGSCAGAKNAFGGTADELAPQTAAAVGSEDDEGTATDRRALHDPLRDVGAAQDVDGISDDAGFFRITK